jgi:hypothetical protein
MTTRLLSITRISDGMYDVVFEVEGARQGMVCTIVDQNGIRAVRPQPDLMMQLGIQPRLIAAAIVAFDTVCASGEVASEAQ